MTGISSRIFAAAAPAVLFAAVFLLSALPGGQVASAQTLERVEDRGRFVIGMRTDAPPFSYIGPDGKPAGFTLMLCEAVVRAVMEAEGLSALDVQLVPVSAEERFEKVAAGEIDLLCGASTITLSRREIVDFSIPVFVDGASFMTVDGGPGSVAELAGQKIAVRAGTTAERALSAAMAEMGAEVDIHPVEDHADGVALVLSGGAAAYFGDRAILLYQALLSGQAPLLQVSETQFTLEPYALAMARGDTEFRLLVDRVLADLYRSGQVMTFFRQSFGERAKLSQDLQRMFMMNALPE